MKGFRITQIQVLIAGGVIAVGIALLFVLVFIRPLRSQIAQDTEVAEQEESYAQTNGPIAERNLARAQEEEQRVTAAYEDIMETRMPKLSLEDPLAAMFELWDLPRREGTLITQWFNSSGARVSAISFPGFGTTLPAQNMRLLPPLSWTLQVEVKDLPDLMKWLLKLPEAPRFMMLRNVSIPGSRQPGQPLVASVSVTLYEWVRPARGAAAAAPARGAAAASAGAEAPGSARRGMMGERGGMMGERGGMMGERGGMMGRGPRGGM